MSLRHKLNTLVRSALASATVFMGSTALAQNTSSKEPSAPTPITQTIPALERYQAFKDQDFDTRMQMAEEICQRHYLSQHTYMDIQNLIQKDTTRTDHRIDLAAYDEILQLVHLGRPIDEIDTTQPYSEQLRDCGFDLLSDLAAGHTDMSKLSDMERAKVLAQLECSSLLGHLPENERADVLLHSKVYSQDSSNDISLAHTSSILNGHKLKDCTLYEASLAKQVSQKLRREVNLYSHGLTK